MSTFSITHNGNPDNKTLWEVPFGAALKAVRVNGEECHQYKQPLPYQVLFDEAPPVAASVEFVMYKPGAVHEGDETEQWPKMVTVAPSDSEDLPSVPRGLFITKGGKLSGITHDGSPLKITTQDGQTLLTLRFRRINAKGTTAEGIIALYPAKPAGGMKSQELLPEGAPAAYAAHL